MSIPDFADYFFQGNSERDCLELFLIQNNKEEPCTMRGAGYIKKNKDGRISFKIFSPTFTNKPSHPIGFPRTNPGTIIDNENFYSFLITLDNGDKWHTENVFPRTSSGLDDFITGNILELRKTIDFNDPQSPNPINLASAAPGHLSLWFEGNILYLQANARTVTNKYVELFDEAEKKSTTDAFPSGSHSNVVKFQVEGCKIEIHKEEGSFKVVAESDRSLPPFVDIRIQESLQFILGRTVFWRTSELSSDGKLEYRVRAVEKDMRSSLPPPIQSATLENIKSEYSVKLFSAYFVFVLKAGSNWHPCSVHLYNAIIASASSKEAYSLGLGVAVEGVCNCLYEEVAKIEKDEIASLKNLLSYLEKWPELSRFTQDAENTSTSHEAASNIFKRAKGVIASIHQSRPLDKMMFLVKSKKISRIHVDAWKVMRNKASHANLPDPAKIQNHVSLRNSAVVLLYHLIFAKIEYEGYYTDYSDSRFSQKWYPNIDV